jgi:hypothetical protein
MAAIAAWNTVYLAKAIEASEVQEVRDIFRKFYMLDLLAEVLCKPP